MAPTAEKVEHKYIPPSFVNKEIVDTLPTDKQTYWANRILGKNGQGVTLPKPTVFKESPATIAFNNLGEMVVHNRQARRNRPANDPQYTKATQSLKVARKKEKLIEVARAKKAAKREKKNAEK